MELALAGNTEAGHSGTPHTVTALLTWTNLPQIIPCVNPCVVSVSPCYDNSVVAGRLHAAQLSLVRQRQAEHPCFQVLFLLVETGGTRTIATKILCRKQGLMPIIPLHQYFVRSDLLDERWFHGVQDPAFDSDKHGI